MIQRLLLKLKMWKGNSYPTLLCLGCSQEAVQTKKECLNIKLMAEQEVVLFRQQLLALRQALARAQADNVKMCRQQENQVSELRTPFLPLCQHILARRQGPELPVAVTRVPQCEAERTALLEKEGLDPSFPSPSFPAQRSGAVAKRLLLLFIFG